MSLTADQILMTRIAGRGDPSSSELRALKLRIKELEEQHLAFRNSLICAFNQLLDLKDISTGVHSTRLAEWAIADWGTITGKRDSNSSVIPRAF